jgi:hypothetical protein
MALVGSAAAADHSHVRKVALERGVFGAELAWVSRVQLRRFVEFGVALA